MGNNADGTMGNDEAIGQQWPAMPMSGSGGLAGYPLGVSSNGREALWMEWDRDGAMLK